MKFRAINMLCNQTYAAFKTTKEKLQLAVIRSPELCCSFHQHESALKTNDFVYTQPQQHVAVITMTVIERDARLVSSSVMEALT